MDTTDNEDFPSEMKQPMSELHQSLVDLKTSLDEFNKNYPIIKSRPLDPLLKAKVELTKAYAINSLFWIYLKTKGVDPRDHPIKGEISRLKTYAERVKQIEDKQKAMKLDKNAAKRFVRSALWEPTPDSTKEETTHKRKHSDDLNDTKETNNKLNHKKNKKFKTK